MSRIAFLLSLLLICGTLFGQSTQNGAQNQGTAEPRTIEELYLSQNVEIQILRTQAQSSDSTVKMLAIQGLRGMVSEGRTSPENQAAVLLLEYLAKQEGDQNTRNFSLVRKEAANLLGDIRTERSEQILISVLQQESEPMVLAEAAYALGKVGLNGNGQATEALMRTLRRENTRPTPDNNLAFAILLSLEKLIQTEAGIKKPEYLTALLGVLESNYIRDVRLKALDVISKLKEAG